MRCAPSIVEVPVQSSEDQRIIDADRRSRWDAEEFLKVAWSVEHDGEFPEMCQSRWLLAMNETLSALQAPSHRRLRLARDRRRGLFCGLFFNKGEGVRASARGQCSPHTPVRPSPTRRWFRNLTNARTTPATREPAASVSSRRIRRRSSPTRGDAARRQCNHDRMARQHGGIQTLGVDQRMRMRCSPAQARLRSGRMITTKRVVVLLAFVSDDIRCIADAKAEVARKAPLMATPDNHVAR